MSAPRTMAASCCSAGSASSYFDKYRLLRMNEYPQIDIVLVNSTEKPGGIGEPATALIGPAVANAVFAATGKRIRDLPLKNHDLKKA